MQQLLATVCSGELGHTVFEYGKVRNLSLNGRRVTDPKTLQGTNVGGIIPPMLNLTVWKDRHHIEAHNSGSTPDSKLDKGF